jgi:hypothetical protein
MGLLYHSFASGQQFFIGVCPVTLSGYILVAVGKPAPSLSFTQKTFLMIVTNTIGCIVIRNYQKNFTARTISSTVQVHGFCVAISIFYGLTSYVAHLNLLLMYQLYHLFSQRQQFFRLLQTVTP